MIKTRNGIIYLFCTVLFIHGLAAIEYKPVKMMVNEKSPVWKLSKIYTPIRVDNFSFFIYEDINIQGYRAVCSDEIIDHNIKYDMFSSEIVIKGTNEIYRINTENLQPVKTETLFPDSWLTKAGDTDRKIWVIDYYLKTMAKQDRNLLLNAEKGWIRTENVEAVLPYKWYEHFASNEGLLIFQGAVSIGSILRKNYWIVNTEAYKNGYKVTVTGDSELYKADEANGTDLTKNLPLPRPSERRQFDLIMLPDGDYMNVYLDSEAVRIATFGRVEKVFLSQFDFMLKNGSYDVSKVIWPRHADGSCDYGDSSKSAVDKIIAAKRETILSAGMKKTAVTNLRLRSTKNMSSTVITTMGKGTLVAVVAVGDKDTIDGITSNWVRVEIQSEAKDKDGKEIKAGTTGWCFGGYLE